MKSDDRQGKLNYLIARDLLSTFDNICWTAGVVLDQVLMRSVREGWEVRLKGSRGGVAVTTAFTMDTWYEAVEVLGEFSAMGAFEWYKDRWPSKNLQGSGTLKNSMGERSSKN